MTTSTAPPVESKRRAWRWWVLLAIGAVWLATVIGVSNVGSFDDQYKFMVNFGVTLICGLVALFWTPVALGMTGKRLAITYIVLAVILASLFADARRNHGFLAWRIVGVTGNLYPRFAPRWKAAVALPSASTQSDSKIEIPDPSERDFPQFLGFNRDATITNVQLARDWKAIPPRVKWRQPIGAGWTAFSIVGKYAFTFEQQDENECVVCYEVETGKAIWKHSDLGRFANVIGGVGPRSSPTIHGGRVYTYGALGRLNCLNASTGEVLWTRAVLEEFGIPPPEWGKSCSPLIVDDLVVVTAGNRNNGALAAYKLFDGAPAWRAGNDDASYSSPILATLAGREQIVIINHGSVTGHDPSAGTVLWSYAWPGDQPKVAQPMLMSADRLLVGAGYGLGSVMLNITEQGGEFAVAKVWESKTMKPKFSNMCHRDGFIYGFDDGVLGCVSAADGKRMWRKGRYGHGQLLLVGDLILLITESGDLALVEANPNEFIELGAFPLFGSKTWNPPALVGKTLLVRNDQEAACLELP